VRMSLAAWPGATGLLAAAMVTSMPWRVARNRIHGIEQRLARWLLRSHDRVLSDQFLCYWVVTRVNRGAAGCAYGGTSPARV
jgi:hypothetical protein